MLGFVLAVLLTFATGPPAEDPTGDAVLKKVEEAWAGLRDFTVTLDIEAHLEQINVPPMLVTMYFKQPDKTHFDGQGFALVPKEAGMLRPSGFLRRFTIERVDRDTLDGVQEFKLVLRPTEARSRVRSATLSVHSARWTMDKLVSVLPDGRTLTAVFTHERVQGFWLPSSLTVSFTAQREAAELPAADDDAPMPFRRQSLRGGTVNIRYSKYHINTGLDDSLFAPVGPPERD